MKESKKWITASGLEVPKNRITETEKAKEKAIDYLVKKAQKLSAELAKFKTEILAASQDILDAVAIEQNINLDKHKGNFSFMNFSKDKKIEVQMNERIIFNEESLMAAKVLLDEFLDSQISTSAAFVKDIIMDAFSTSRGRVDSRKVMGLLQYQNKIDHPKFQQACELISQAQDRPASKIYARLSLKNDKGEFENIDLNFSSL